LTERQEKVRVPRREQIGEWSHARRPPDLSALRNLAVNSTPFPYFGAAMLPPIDG
jgi:hypothetical protein